MWTNKETYGRFCVRPAWWWDLTEVLLKVLFFWDGTTFRIVSCYRRFESFYSSSESGGPRLCYWAVWPKFYSNLVGGGKKTEEKRLFGRTMRRQISVLICIWKNRCVMVWVGWVLNVNSLVGPKIWLWIETPGFWQWLMSVMHGLRLCFFFYECYLYAGVLLISFLLLMPELA